MHHHLGHLHCINVYVDVVVSLTEHSSIVDAHFQAAVTLREGTMRDWVLLSTEERQAIRTFCLRYVLARTPEPPQYVRGQLMAVVACILKRSWYKPLPFKPQLLASFKADLLSLS
jgi:hypothetical protein